MQFYLFNICPKLRRRKWRTLRITMFRTFSTSPAMFTITMMMNLCLCLFVCSLTGVWYKTTVHLVVFIAYILIFSVTDCCIHCFHVHVFSSSAASVIIKFSVQEFIFCKNSFLSQLQNSNFPSHMLNTKLYTMQQFIFKFVVLLQK